MSSEKSEHSSVQQLSPPDEDIKSGEADLLYEGTAVVEVKPKTDMTSVRPQQLGPYAVDGELGRGAMGVVYRATHTKLKRQVALKVLPASSTMLPKRLSRFHREMEAVGRLDHPNIVRATDAGEFEGVHYLAMELIAGNDLEKLLDRKHRFDLGSACEAARQAALGLQHIHENKLVHRDIKPSNMLLTDGGLIKILDLGIAMLRQHDGGHGQTSVGALMGTPDFMAPEQAEKTYDVDIRADIYSLGCTLFTLLAGKPPFHGPDFDTQVAKIVAHSKVTPPLLTTVVPGAPKELAKIVQRMMAKHPADRYQTPMEVVEALTPWANEAGLAHLAESITGQAPQSCRGTVPNSADHTVRRPRRAATAPGTLPMKIKAAIVVGVIVILAGAVIPLTPRQETPESNTPLAAGLSRPSAPDDPDVIGQPNSAPPAPDEIVAQSVVSEKIAESIGHVAEDTSQIRKNSGQLVDTSQAISRNTQRIADSLDDLRDSFQVATRHGGLIQNPQSVGEFYHNARVCEQQGSYTLARENYLRLFQSGVEFIDVHRHFQQFLKLQEGPAGAREVYRALPGDPRNSVRACAAALLEELPERERQLTALVQRDPNFAPGVYELSRCWSQALLGDQALADKANEKRLLEEFLRLSEEGHVLRHFLDHSEAASIIEDAQQRLASLGTLDTDLVENPVTLSCSRHRGGWSLVFHVAEAAAEIFYRVGSTGEFQSTGFTNYVDPRTGRHAPRTFASLPPNAEQCSVEVTYVDVRGIERGPYTLDFDPTIEAIRDAKRKLELTKNSWLSFGRNQDRDKLYFTHLTFYQEAIDEVHYAVDQDEPTIVHQLPKLDDRHDANLSVSIPHESAYAVVQVTFRDGTTSEIVRVERP